MKKLALIFLVLLVFVPGCSIYPWTVPTISVFNANPTTITSGDSATLVWNVVGATGASIDQGVGAVPLAGTRTVSPTATTIYTLSAINGTVTVTRSTVIIVNPPPTPPTPPPPPVPSVTATFTVNPNVITQGDSALLQWSVTGATNIAIDQNIGNVPANGSQTISPSATTTYTLTATNSANSLVKSVVLTVNPPPIIANFAVNPGQITSGQYATLSWNVSGATAVRIDPSVGDVPYSGSIAVNPTTTTTYVLTATSSCCALNKTAVLVVNTPVPPPSLPVVQFFSINPATIHTGGTAILQWNVTNADSVFITSLGSVPLVGSIIINPTTTTIFTLTATNAYGTRVYSVGIVVTP